MMRILVIVCLEITQLHSVDCVQNTFGHPFCINHAQAQLLHRALNEAATLIAIGDTEANDDICNWRGIDCTEGLATSVDIRAVGLSDKALIQIDWLPPTLAFIHLKYTFVSSKSAYRPLPRELKYLYLGYCSDKTLSIDFIYLPRKLEEIILIESSIYGEIRLDNMPMTMRIIHIRQFPEFIKEIFVNYDSLPPSLQEIRVTWRSNNERLNQKVKAVGTPRSVILQTKYDRRYPKKESRYLEMFLQKGFAIAKSA